MSVETVYEALRSAIQPDGDIDIWAAANQSGVLSPLVSVLGLYGFKESYVLSNAQLGKQNELVTLNATGQFGQPGAPASNQYAITANLAYQDGQGGFVLTFIFNDRDWRFDHFFNSEYLPQCRRKVNINDTGWTKSFLIGLTLNTVSLVGRSGVDEKLQLSGLLLQNELFDRYSSFVSPWPLGVSGTVVMPVSWQTYPLLSLQAMPSGGSSLSLMNDMVEGGSGGGPSGLSLSQIGLQLSIVEGLDEAIWGREAFSSLEFVGELSLGTLKANLSSPLLISDTVWALTVNFDPEHSSLVEGASQLTTLFGVPALPLPDNFPLISEFRFSELAIYGSFPTAPGEHLSVNNLALTIQSAEEWNPPVPFVTLSDIGTRWVWAWSTYKDSEGKEVSQSMVTGSVFGTINLGKKSNAIGHEEVPKHTRIGGSSDMVIGDQASDNEKVPIDVSLKLPSLFIGAAMREGSYIAIGDAFDYFFNKKGPDTPANMNISDLRFNADPIGQNFSAGAEIIFGPPDQETSYRGWEIDLLLVQLDLQKLNFFINVNSGHVGGGISGEFLLIQGEDPEIEDNPRMLVQAEFPVQDKDGPGWEFSGYLYPGTSIDLIKLAKRFLKIESTSSPQGLFVDELSVSIATKEQTYSLAGTMSARWKPKIFSITPTINASASVDLRRDDGQSHASGVLSGSFSVNKMSLMASMDIGVPEPTYLFKIQFDEIWLQATTSWRGESDNRHQVISLQLGGLTLGDMLEYLVNLAAPTLGFKLESPWDALKKIDLSRFVLTVDPKENVVEFVFNTNVDLVIAKLDSVGVRYSKKTGEGKVDMILTGSFLGQNYNSNDPLSWDVINDPPPEVPGAGKSLVDLRYLGLGQRVTFRGATPSTVADSVALLRSEMAPPPDDGSPIVDGKGLKYSSDSQWLIGLDIKLIDTLDLAFIFNDPKLYGLSIGLGGERAGSLAGLKFEILYKKITNDIGMFRIEFQVPDMFRTIELGAVSVTLGIIVLEIYTNGNFKVDLGFPYDRNFDRSFSLQASIFIGRGGFYLGVLNGDTSTQVPRISNGNFSPVIELGIGIAAGVGREVKKGILSGGAYVQLEVIFEGVMAWFNPDSSGVAPAKLFKCQGVIALHGKIYGSVDFVVIKVSVTLEAYAQASLTYESYQPMLIDLLVDVSAEASLEVLFITVHFSFHVSLELSFKIGSAQPTPWILDHGASGGGDQLAVTGNRTQMKRSRAAFLRGNKHRRMNALRQAHFADARLQAMAVESVHTDQLVEDGYLLNWRPSNKVFPDSPRNAHMTLLPLFTIGDMPMNWSATAPDNPSPDYRAAFVLCADTGMSPTAQTAAECTRRSAAHSAMTSSDVETGGLAADLLTEGVIRYAIDALPRNPEQGSAITVGQIELILEQLDMPETMLDGFSMGNLETFFKTNIHVWISGDLDVRPDGKSSMVVPMPPFLQWTSPQAGDVNFSDYNKIGKLYEWGISQRLNAYFPVGPEGSSKPKDDDPADYESFTSFMFRDFCLMLLKNSIKEIQSNMAGTKVTVTKAGGKVQNLEQVANGIPTAEVSYVIVTGDTLENVAEHLGATVEELEFLNPNLVNDLKNKPVGTELTIKLGIPPEVIALDNSSKSFAISQCDLGTVIYQAQTDDALGRIAGLFQVTQVENLLSYQNPDYPQLSASQGILKPGSVFSLQAQTYHGPAGLARLRTAANFFTRYMDISVFRDSQVSDMANWYVQAITEINKNILGGLFPNQHIPSEVELPPGHTLSVPNAYNNNYSDAGGRNDYQTVNGDTLHRIAYALTLQQDYSDTSPVGAEDWQTFQKSVTSVGSDAWSIPAQDDIPVLAGETIESLVRRLVLNAQWTESSSAGPSDGTWAYDWAKIVVWLGISKVLEPLASITVPGAKTANHNPLSFDVITQEYGVSIVEAAAVLKKTQGLFAANTELQVKHLPAQDIDVLITEVLSGQSFPSIVNQSSRMLMSGLQLPGLAKDGNHVVPDTEHPKPLYDLTGQQFDVAVDEEKGDETALSLSVSSEKGWIQLLDSITVVEGDTLAGLETRYPKLLDYNPGLSEKIFKVGMLLLTQPVETTLNYSYTNQQIIDDGPGNPDKGLAVLPIPAEPPNPVAMPLSGTVPKTYGLEHRIEIQTPVALPIPELTGGSGVGGNPSLWMFPENFLLNAKGSVSTKYEILSTRKGAKAGADATEIKNSTYGSIVSFKIKQIDDGTSEFALVGVDTENRHLLISLRAWLQGSGNAEKTKAYMLLSPAPNASNTSGLTLFEAEKSYLMKSNLSTESVPPTLLEAYSVESDPENVYSAPLSSLMNFVTLLWEGSVVGGTGYYFGAGQKIPGSAVDDQGNITLNLLVIAGTQQQLAPDGRALLPFNNCALIGSGLDDGLQTLFIESEDGSETITQSLVPPGNVGFKFLTEAPLPTKLEKHELVKKNLYSLLAFSVVSQEGSPFVAQSSGLPVMPKPTDQSTLETWRKEKARRKNKTPSKTRHQAELYRSYEQVLPVSRFISENIKDAAPDVQGLPLPSQDPYRGYGIQKSIPSAKFSFGFGDVFGNRTGQNGAGQGVVDLPVGYTDSLIGLSEWPSVASQFEVSKAKSGTGAVLKALIACRPSELMITPSQSGGSNKDEIAQQVDKYRSIYYQLIQPGIEAWMVTSLKVVADPDYGNKGLKIDDIMSLWKFAGGAFVNATSLSSFGSAKPVAIAKLGGIISSYGVRYTELAQANAEKRLDALFGGTVPVVPAFFPYIENQSIAGICGKLPKGWPVPAVPADVLKSVQNEDLPLRVGTLLKIPTKSISSGDAIPTDALETLAKANHTTVKSLVEGNADKHILQAGFEFKVDIDDELEAVVIVDAETNSLTLVVKKFEKDGVHVTEEALAQQNKAKEGMLASDKMLDLSHYLVVAGDTLASNRSSVSVDELAEKNADISNLFDPGALVYIGPFTDVVTGTNTISLQEFGDRYACPVELLLKANADFNLPASSAFVLPGILQWPEQTNVLRTPYSVGSSETLQQIAGKFSKANGEGDASFLLAQINENMPELLVPGSDVNIQVDGSPYSVNTGTEASFAYVLVELKKVAPSATLQDIVTSVAGESGILQPGGWMLCPPVKLSKSMNPSDIESAYHVSAQAFGMSNAAMPQMIISEERIYSSDGDDFIITEANDTLNTLVVRFADKQINMTVSDIMTAEKNQDVVFLKSDALALLPPKRIDFEVELGAGGPYPSPISPLEVSLRFLRPADLIHPDFKTAKGTGSVEMVESVVSAPSKKSGKNNGLTFDRFVADMKEALPDIRLGTGRVDGVRQDLWIVDFDTNGIKMVELDGALDIGIGKMQPRFFALVPLYSHLVSRSNILIKQLVSDGSLSDTGDDIAFQSVDVELWARKFMEDYDRFLSGPYATALYNDQVTRPYFQNAMEAKEKLIPAIADDLNKVLDIDAAGDAKALDDARVALKQQLGISLAKTYESAVMVQYDTTVGSPWQMDGTDLLPASLYGDGSIVGAETGITMISAKTKLAEAHGYANFLMSVDDPSWHRQISGSFEYAYSHAEFNISSQNLPDGYSDSDWLTFVPLLDKAEKPSALSGTDPTPEVDIPIPLRVFPSLPIIIGQSADQTHTDDITSVGQLGLWDYTFTYSHEHAEQDYVMLTVDFNLKKPAFDLEAVQRTRDLFTELAQYQAVATPLWEYLGGLVDKHTKVPLPSVREAAKTFVDLAQNIGSYWGTRLSSGETNMGAVDQLVAGSSDEFKTRVGLRDGQFLNKLTLTKVKTSGGMEDLWPSVYVKKPDGDFCKLDPKPMEGDAKIVVYEVPAGVEASMTTWPVFKLAWENLSLTQYQNARSKMSVERNQDLIGDDKTHIETNPQFLFSTSEVVVPSVVTPLNTYAKPVSINDLGASLATALNESFLALFKTEVDGQKVTMELSYGYELVSAVSDAKQGLTTYLPIALYPNQTLTGTTGNDLSEVVNQWKTANNPSEAGGEWAFSLRLYSKLTEVPQILLVIDHMVYDL